MKENFKKTYDFCKKNIFIILIIIFAIFKSYLASNLALWAQPGNPFDDVLMLEMSDTIYNGDWLGTYTSDKLVKGPFFPTLTAIISKIGLPYLFTMNLIYILACVFFVYAIKSIIKSKKLRFLIYLILLFNPAAVAGWNFQRFYRNGITISQVLFLIGLLFLMYERRNEKITKILPFSIFGGIVLSTMWHNREDGIWIIPFVLGVIFVTIISLLLKNKGQIKTNIKSLSLKIFVVMLPIILLLCSNITLRVINNMYYGVATYNEINDGNFGKVIQSMYSIKTDEDIKYVTVTRKKLNKIYEASPTLNTIKENLEKSMNSWAKADRNPEDLEVEDGWFWWALKGGVDNAGYYTNAKTANEFYKKVYDELESAKEKGSIDHQATMPSKLMSPWKERYIKELPKTFFTTLMYVVKFDGMETVQKSGSQNGIKDLEYMRRFERITNNVTMYPSELIKNVNVKGWFVKNKDENYILKIFDKDDIEVSNIEILDSPDVYNSLSFNGNENENAKKARFDIYLKDVDFNELYITVINEKTNEIVEKIKIEKDIVNVMKECKSGILYVDNYEAGFADPYITRAKIYSDKLNVYRDLYNKFSKYFFVLGVISYILIVFMLLFKKIKNQTYLSTFLLLTGIAISFIILLLGVSYNHITACNSILYMYLSGAYPLVITFNFVSIFYVIENIKDWNFKKQKEVK